MDPLIENIIEVLNDINKKYIECTDISRKLDTINKIVLERKQQYEKIKDINKIHKPLKIYNIYEEVKEDKIEDINLSYFDF